MTDSTSTHESQLLADSVRRYVDRGYGTVQRGASVAHRHGCIPDIWRQFGSFGWLALPIGEADGGLGGSLDDVCKVAEELGRGAVNEPFIACAVLASALFADVAPDPAKSAWLPGLLEGNRRIAFAPAGGLTAFSAGGLFSLHGHTPAIPGGAGVDAYLLTAELDGGSEAGLFLIEPGISGFVINSCTLYDGQGAARLRLDDVSTAGALWIGPLPQLRHTVERALNRGTVVHCAQTVGTMQRTLEITLDYLKMRKQFGRAVASNQVVQHRLVDLLVEIEEARALSSAAALVLDDATSHSSSQGRYTAAAKACVAGAAEQVWKEAVQLHGAIGMTQEYEVGQFVKRLAAACTLYGSKTTHLERLAEISLDSATGQQIGNH